MTTPAETTPDWRSRVIDTLAQRRVKTARKGPAIHEGAFHRSLHPVNFNASMEFMHLFHQAAKLRNVNLSSYGRRAISLLIAHDLGLPIHQVLWETPCIGRYGRVQNSPGERDAGEGIEAWCPHPDCDGAHLSLR